MRPWQHAKSSARHAGGSWLDDLPVHEFIDMTKNSCPDMRHRMVLHHVDLGLALAQIAFPNRPGIETLVRRHVEEDLGMCVSLGDWFACCDAPRLPKPLYRRCKADAGELHAMAMDGLHPCVETLARCIVDLLFLPCRFVSNEDAPMAQSLLMNAVGPPIVRACYGGPREITHDHGVTTVDPAEIAETFILLRYGRIPDLSEVVFACRPWNARSQGVACV